MAKRSPIWEMEDKYESVKRWMTRVMSRSGSEGTKRNYLYQLKKYCSKVGKNPDELVEERKDHLKSEDEMTQHRHEEMLLNLFNELDKEKSRGTALSYFKIIKSFYGANYLDLKIDTPKQWTSFTDKVPSLEDLNKMIDVTQNPMEKAVILFCAQSGQRVGVVTAMTYGMLREALNGSESPISIHINGELANRKGTKVNKNRQDYIFFIGADAVNALKSYIDRMKVLGYTFKESSPLFLTEKKYYGKVAEKGETLKGNERTYKALDREAVNRIIRRCAIKAGLMDKEGVRTPGGITRFPIHTHCMRKFWQTAMEQAGVAKPWYEYIMGHSLGELDKAYSRPTVDQLGDAYARAESYMTVSKLNIPDVENMKREMMLAMFQQFARMMSFDPNRVIVNAEKDIGRKLSRDEEIEVLQETLIKGMMEKKIENNKREHRIVTEGELEGYLDDGWEFMNEISGGKFVVRGPLVNGIA